LYALSPDCQARLTTSSNGPSVSITARQSCITGLTESANPGRKRLLTTRCAATRGLTVTEVRATANAASSTGDVPRPSRAASIPTAR
jgi:hypothetical protein